VGEAARALEGVGFLAGAEGAKGDLGGFVEDVRLLLHEFEQFFVFGRRIIGLLRSVDYLYHSFII